MTEDFQFPAIIDLQIRHLALGCVRLIHPVTAGLASKQDDLEDPRRLALALGMHDDIAKFLVQDLHAPLKLALLGGWKMGNISLHYRPCYS